MTDLSNSEDKSPLEEFRPEEGAQKEVEAVDESEKRSEEAGAPAEESVAETAPVTTTETVSPVSSSSNNEDDKDDDFVKPTWFSKFMGFLGELAHVVIISLAIIIPIRYFLIQPFYVKGASMEPNFYDKEYLIIDEISYRFTEPSRGDVVVFRYPNDPTQYFIKRVVALPGEQVKVERGSVFVYDVNGEGGKLDETAYLGNKSTSGNKDATLEEGQYYLLGDNRGSSLDSRSFGYVKENLIVGKVWFRGWPPERLTFFDEESENASVIIAE